MATKIPKKERKKHQDHITKQEKDSYLLSLATAMIAAYIVLSFIKASLAHHYLIHLYVDSAVAVVALVIFFMQFKYQRSLYKKYHNTRTPLIITIASIAIGLVCVIIAYKSIDFSAVVLLIGLIATKKIAEKEWQK